MVRINWFSSVKNYYRDYTLPLLPVGAIILWLFSLRHVDLRAMNDLGLISVLPPSVFIALLLLTISFCLLLTQPDRSDFDLLLHVLILIFMLYGIAPLLEGVPRTPISWKLMGIIDRVMQTGTVDPSRDAFQNWPGFFILSAFFTQVMGLKTPIFLATWAPVFLNLLYMAPLYMIYRVATGDRRLIWMGMWFFCLANWIGQDYLSPQGFNYFFFLVILAILLQWFKHTPEQPEPFYMQWLSKPLRWKPVEKLSQLLGQVTLRDMFSSSWQRVGLLAIIIILFGAMVPSHQLTPFATIAAVSSLVAFKRATPRSLPILMAVITGAWISYMAVAYLTGHIDTVASPVGSLGGNISANLTDRFRGSVEHIFILELRVVITWIIWMLAAAGAIRRWRKGLIELTFLLLAGVPFSLMALQAYGGELLMRAYLFSLAFTAFFGAALFFPSHTAGRSWYTPIAVALASMALIVSFMFTRYGNERMDYFTPQEVQAVQHLYEIAQPGAQILVGTQTLPWRFQDYDTYWYRGVEKIVRSNDIEGLVQTMRDRKYSISYLLLTRSERTSAHLYLGWPPGTWERFVNSMLDSGRFDIIYSNPDAMILVLNPERAGP